MSATFDNDAATQDEIKAQTGLTLSKSATSADFRGTTKIEGGKLVLTMQDYLNWYCCADNTKNNAELFKYIFGEGGYDKVVLELDIAGATTVSGAKDAQGALVRMQATDADAYAGQRQYAAFFGCQGEAFNISFGGKNKIGGDNSSLSFVQNANYRIRMVFDTKNYSYDGYVANIAEDGTVGEFASLGKTASYQNIVDYVNAQYEERIGGTATTLDAKMKELAAKNVAVDILLGRDNAKWRVVIDNFELYSAK